MLRIYLLPAWKSLSRNLAYSFITISGLSIGICACIIIYIVASYEFSFDDFHPAGNRIYRLGARIQEDVGNSFATEGYGEDVPPPALPACRQEIPGFEAISGFYPYPADVTVPRPSAPAAHIPSPQTILADTAYFSVFHYDWLAGNPATALLNPFSVVLTASQARKYFGPARHRYPPGLGPANRLPLYQFYFSKHNPRQLPPERSSDR